MFQDLINNGDVTNDLQLRNLDSNFEIQTFKVDHLVHQVEIAHGVKQHPKTKKNHNISGKRERTNVSNSHEIRQGTGARRFDDTRQDKPRHKIPSDMYTCHRYTAAAVIIFSTPPDGLNLVP